MRNPLERDIEKHFVDYANSRHCRALKLRIDGANGFPDRTVLTTQGIFFAEFKRGRGGVLSKQQEAIIQELNLLRYQVITPRKIGQAEDFLDLFLRNGGNHVPDDEAGNWLAEEPKGTCDWEFDLSFNKYDTDCGEAHAFAHGGPDENCHVFCPYCGRRILS